MTSEAIARGSHKAVWWCGLAFLAAAALLPWVGAGGLSWSRVLHKEAPDYTIFMELRVTRCLLALLAGSHRIDTVHDHHFSLGAGGLAIDTGQLEGEWVTTDYAIGDTLIFHSLTVHQALPNRDGRPSPDLAG